LWCAVRERKGVLYYTLAAVLLAAGLTSASRAGAAVLVVETAVVILVAWQGKHRKLLSLAVVALTLAALAGGGHLLERLDEADPYRQRIFASAADMIADAPVSGFGLGTFAAVYPAYARFDAGRTVEHAHNDWLEWTAEGGWGFLALWLLFAGALARPAWTSVWGLGIPAVFLHALVDYPFARFGVAAWVFILAGALPPSRKAVLRREKRAARPT
jgi:O-antigen ligase